MSTTCTCQSDGFPSVMALRLDDCRKDLGISVAELAQRAGLDDLVLDGALHGALHCDVDVIAPVLTALGHALRHARARDAAA